MPAALCERLDVGSRRGIRVHVVVHRRCGENEAIAAGEQQRRQHIVRHSHRGAGEHVRGRGRDDDEIRVFREMDVGERSAPLPERSQDGTAGEGFEGQRAHELGGGRRQDDIHRCAGFGEPARQRTALVTGDPARHAEHDVTGRAG